MRRIYVCIDGILWSYVIRFCTFWTFWFMFRFLYLLRSGWPLVWITWKCRGIWKMSGILLTVGEMSGKKSCHRKVFQNYSLLVEYMHSYWYLADPILVLHSSCGLDSEIIYIRGRQSPARGPNPAREFRPSGPRRLVSFNIKFGLENVPNDERLFSRWAWFSRTLIVNAERLSYTRWRWLTPFTLDPSVTSLVQLGHFLVTL